MKRVLESSKFFFAILVESPSIASIVIFDIFGVRVSVFLYTYYVYLMFYGRCSQLW